LIGLVIHRAVSNVVVPTVLRRLVIGVVRPGSVIGVMLPSLVLRLVLPALLKRQRAYRDRNDANSEEQSSHERPPFRFFPAGQRYTSSKTQLTPTTWASHRV
jgi:hypothetical protein